MITNKNLHEKYIRQIKEIGEILIKNAESIVGNEKELRTIDINVYLNQDEVPAINISKKLLTM